MNKVRIPDPTLLVASDNGSDAEMVKKLLDVEFSKVYKSVDIERATVDFDHCQPNVMILAFSSLEDAERYYLGLYRHQGAIHLNLHRAIVLCGKDEVERAYQLCREGIFDDYILFWPMTHDAPRLRMTVHLALREMNSSGVNSPSAAEFAVQVKRMTTLGREMNQRLEQGSKYIESIDHAVRQADSEAHAAFDQFSQRLARNEVPGVTVINNNDVLQNEIGRVKQEVIDVPRSRLSDSVSPLKQWAGDMRDKDSPHMESMRALNEISEKIPPVLLVVDDEVFQHKILGFMLKEARYQVMFATSVEEAMDMLGKHDLPDLILLDVMLPNIDGVEAARLIKSDSRTADVPIIMMTGNSEKDILEASLDAGACDFIVKPFASNTLLGKLNHALNKSCGSSSNHGHTARLE